MRTSTTTISSFSCSKLSTTWFSTSLTVRTSRIMQLLLFSRLRHTSEERECRPCVYVTGNSNLVYTIIRKRAIFHQLANLPIDHSSIAKALTKRGRRLSTHEEVKDVQSMEGSHPATDAQPGTLKASLAAVPGRWRLLKLESIYVRSRSLWR